jgi:predicted TIM-barrel fold metal-dependent hydrolase
VENQLQVMAAIARWRARPPAWEQGWQQPVPVFAFAPFDPWRYLEDKQNQRQDMLTVASKFIEDGSIVGFKLYPPMGFAPAGNADKPDEWFPKALRTLVGPNVGAKLDGAMDDLFRYCVAGDVPIMAHCASSEFPADPDDKAPRDVAWGAAPGFWNQALAKHNGLRVNLGHFGGVWDFGAGAPPGATQEDKDRQDLAQRWAREIVSMMVNEKYPNLYADIAFASSLLPARGDTEEQAAWAFLHDMLGGNPVLRQRLMYGSDWEMVGQAADGNDYARHLLANVADLFPGAGLDDFRWRNAARFLGLGATDKTRVRLAKFLTANAADPAILAPFDPATA